MAEQEQTLGHTSDNNASRLPLGDNRLLAARQDFGTALSIVSSVTDLRIRDNAYLKVAQEQAEAGLEPVYPPNYFVNVVGQRDSLNRNDMYEGITLLQAHMGDVQGALQTAELTYGFPWFYTGLARVLTPQGVDTQPVFDRIYGKFRVGDAGDARWAGQAAEAQRELGLVPAKAVLDRFRGYKSRDGQYMDSYNLGLATSYAIAGFPEDALEVWRKTKGNGYHQRAEGLSIVAVSLARSGADPSELVAATVNLTEAIKAKEQYHPGWKQVEIYANLAKANALAGKDPQPMVDRALQKVLEEPSNLRADAYTELAKAQVDFGADARPTIALALEWADDIVKPGEEADAGYGIPIQILNWEDIFHAQLSGGLFNDARATLERLDRYPDQDMIGHKAELLAELGRAEIKAA